MAEDEVFTDPDAVRDSIITADKLIVRSTVSGVQRQIWKRIEATKLPRYVVILPYSTKRELRNILEYVDQLKNQDGP